MKIALVMTLLLLLPAMMVGQAANSKSPPNHQAAAPMGNAVQGFPFSGVLNSSAGLFDQFWNDPAIAAELHLTDIQRKQLRDFALTQQLSLIDSGANALKALVRLSVLLEADQLDDPAYKQQVNDLAAVAGKLVQDVGEMAATPRRVLSLEQWQKLRTLERAKRAQVPSPLQPPSTSTLPPAGMP
jgi:Spy/CpxP family protein refolding chaperone